MPSSIHSSEQSHGCGVRARFCDVRASVCARRRARRNPRSLSSRSRTASRSAGPGCCNGRKDGISARSESTFQRTGALRRVLPRQCSGMLSLSDGIHACRWAGSLRPARSRRASDRIVSTSPFRSEATRSMPPTASAASRTISETAPLSRSASAIVDFPTPMVLAISRWLIRAFRRARRISPTTSKGGTEDGSGTSEPSARRRLPRGGGGCGWGWGCGCVRIFMSK